MQYCEENIDISFFKAWLNKRTSEHWRMLVQGTETLKIVVFLQSKNREEVWLFTSIDSLNIVISVFYK